jgi:hypothetical protein
MANQQMALVIDGKLVLADGVSNVLAAVSVPVSAYIFSADSAVSGVLSGTHVTSRADGNMLMVGTTASPYIARYDWNSSERRYEYNGTGVDIGPGSYINSVCATSEDGTYMVLPLTVSPFLVSYKWSSVNDRYERTAPIDILPQSSPYGVAHCMLSADGQILTVANYGSYASASGHLYVYRWNASNNRYEQTGNCDVQCPDAARSANINYPNYNKCIVTHQDNTALKKYVFSYTWDEVNNRYKKDNHVDISLPTHGWGGWIKSDGSRMVGGSHAGFASYLWSDVNNRYEKTANPFPVQTTHCSYFCPFNDGEYLAIGGMNGGFHIYKWNAGNNRYEGEILDEAIEGGQPFGVTSGWTMVGALQGSNVLVVSRSDVSPYIKTYRFTK